MESIETAFVVAVVTALVIISWDTSEIKKRLKQLAESEPNKVLECPYGYGTCFASPTGYKPCFKGKRIVSDTADGEAGCRDDERA